MFVWKVGLVVYGSLFDVGSRLERCLSVVVVINDVGYVVGWTITKIWLCNIV